MQKKCCLSNCIQLLIASTSTKFIRFLFVFQLVVAILFVIIGGLNINKQSDHTVAIILNDVILIFVFIISLVNIIISGFGIEYSNQPLKLINQTPMNQISTSCNCSVFCCTQVTAALISVISAILMVNEGSKYCLIAAILNQISLGFVTGALFCDVIKMNFGLDPAIAVNVTIKQFIIFNIHIPSINKIIHGCGCQY